MVAERRHFERVQFGRGYTARIVAIDGTWERECRIADVSDTGAKLAVKGSLAGLDMREFFLMLSASGNAFRHCKRIWLDGEEMGIQFLKDLPPGPRKREWSSPDGPPDSPSSDPS
jgi:PilZ domain